MARCIIPRDPGFGGTTRRGEAGKGAGPALGNYFDNNGMPGASGAAYLYPGDVSPRNSDAVLELRVPEGRYINSPGCSVAEPGVSG